MTWVIDGYIVPPRAFDLAEVRTLRAGVGDAVTRAVTLAAAVGSRVGHNSRPGKQIQIWLLGYS
ncbi:MAG: hypothetical protein ACRDS1_10915 [Pseudonocardiaceae bacterium]